MSTEYEASLYVVFSIPLLRRPSQAKISSQHPTPQQGQSMSSLNMETKFHTSAKQQEKLLFCVS
jgi:hypothetical protein